MYRPPDKSIKQNGYYINRDVADRLNAWLATIDTTSHIKDTIETEGYAGSIFSIAQENGGWTIFHYSTPILNIHEFENQIVETQFLLNGTDISSQVVANTMTIAISAYRVGLRQDSEGYHINISQRGDHTGNYSGQKITIVKGQTLVWIRQLYQKNDQDARKEEIYIKELQGTATAPLKEVCPKRQGQLHEYVCWFHYGETAYQSCRYCNSLWSKSPRSKVYRLLEHSPTHIASEIKAARMHEEWFLSLPGTEIWWEEEGGRWAWLQWNTYLNEHKIHIISSYNANVPSYPATPEQIERAEQEKINATH